MTGTRYAGCSSKRSTTTGLFKGGDNVETGRESDDTGRAGIRYGDVISHPLTDSGSFYSYGYPPGKAPCSGHMCPVLKILIISCANLHKVSIFP